MRERLLSPAIFHMTPFSLAFLMAVSILGFALSKTQPFLWFQMVQAHRMINELRPCLTMPCTCSDTFFPPVHEDTITWLRRQGLEVNKS